MTLINTGLAQFARNLAMDGKTDKKKRSITLDAVAHGWSFPPGVKPGFRHFPDGHVWMSEIA